MPVSVQPLRLCRKALAWFARRRVAGRLEVYRPLLACALAMALTTHAVASEVSLYVSPTTAAYFPSVGGSYDAMLTPWRSLFAAQGRHVRELDRVEDLSGLEAGVLILPSALALNGAERAALLRYRDAGGSILATWAIGSRDEQGRWLGYEFSRELFNVQVVGEMPVDAATRFLIPYGDTPVNQSVAAGRRTWLGQLPERPLLLKGGIEAAAYLNWSRTVLKIGDHHSAIVFDESSRHGRRGPAGRWVMLGFAETAWGFQPTHIHPLVDDALRWLQRQPAAQLAAWPNGLRAAQVIEMDTEEGFGNAIHFAELMEAMNAAGTFYSLTSEARKHADLVRRLVRRHEIGFHGEVHLGFKWLSKDKQQRRFDRMMAEMIDILGKAPDGWPAGAGRGFRAPTEAYDGTTEQILHAMGFRHHAADPNSSDDRLPFFSRVTPGDPARGLVVLPRGQLDDLSYQELNLSAEQAGAALIAEYELNLRMGGLGLLSVHSQNFADPHNLLSKRSHSTLMTLAVEDLTRHIGPRHEKAWIAPAGVVSDWWRARSSSALSVRAAGRRLDLEITVSGHTPVSGLTVLVSHPAVDIEPRFQARRAGAALPTLRPVDRLTSALVFGALAPGTHTLRVTFP